ncbi:hypothetical protein ACM5ME_16980 [Bacillus subtilis]|uniref:hypothetical protein n=1 Tax=Bacillus subtilis TaxID=1423 RepID=UPI002029EB01|nr:hypothetical protein [Bacillus subtilis]
MQHEEALKHAEQALEDAEKLGENYLIRKALFNIGISYINLNHLQNLPFITARAYLMLAFNEGKQENPKKAREFYDKSKQKTLKCNEKIVLAKLKMVEAYTYQTPWIL